jgi:hypothetical protein
MTKSYIAAFFALLLTAVFVNPLFAQEKIDKQSLTPEKYLESLVGGDIIDVLPDKSWTSKESVRAILVVKTGKQKVAYTLESTFNDKGELVDAKILDDSKAMGGIPIVVARINDDRLYQCGRCCARKTSDPASYGWCYWICVALGEC